MERQEINFPAIHLEWSEWFNWNDLIKDARSGGIHIPNGKPGVYEAKLRNSLERLTIGETSDLRMRIRQGLIKGKTGHPSGKKSVLMKILVK